MQIIGDAPLGTPDQDTRRSVVTIGAYDGVHSGHRAVIAQVRERAQALGCRSVVVTFDRHPASVVRPESAPKLLTSLEQKLELLAETGIDAVYVVRFDDERSQETPTAFVQRALVGDLRAKEVVVGEDFHFGHKRSGNVALLREVGAAHDFTVAPLELIARPDGVAEPVSSTAIRRALAGGQVEVACRLLGREFEIRGVVVHGDERGRTIGFPTANVEVSGIYCMPADGVYAGRVTLDDDSVHSCAINIGRRPTFVDHADHSLLEVHLLDFSGDLYDRHVRVAFVKFLRSERKFEGLDALKAQLAIDIAAARDAVV